LFCPAQMLVSMPALSPGARRHPNRWVRSTREAGGLACAFCAH
jgi:hypothetical protein